MSLKIAFLFACLAAVSGAAVGYYLRVLVSLGKKGSMELKLKQQELQAEEKAKKIISDAETKAIETIKEIRVEKKEKEEKLKKTEDRLVKKEDLLDHRQTELDKEVENIKGKIAEIKKIKEKIEADEKTKAAELEKI